MRPKITLSCLLQNPAFRLGLSRMEIGAWQIRFEQLITATGKRDCELPTLVRCYLTGQAAAQVVASRNLKSSDYVPTGPVPEIVTGSVFC